MSDPKTALSYDAANSRYNIEVDGQPAGFASFTAAGEGVRNFNHTVIDPAFRGQGLSSPLIRFALDDTREQGLKIIPGCSAVEHFLNKNEDYKDLAV
ncbi:GNAT family N-acetyltransferase [Corynebacterium sp. A21]|uniref:GNAT family N-acetyltransferase n=1 Tax=Corynebacterium sp. A21 TaxID=3457318 RepID=UPI003FD35CBF